MSLLWACSPYKPLATPSGRPEVTIEGVTCPEVVTALAEGALDQGWEIKEQSDVALAIVEKYEKVHLSAQESPSPLVMLVFNCISKPGCVRVFANSKKYYSSATQNDRTEQTTERHAQGLQQTLDSLVSVLAERKKPHPASALPHPAAKP
ncbi:hypothetical protein Deba_2857 [Desulfarculus baarsii DSM 2075]|uniref:Uncharacterized protein n=2 Tax=Desulfarculus baarsii TaxID=453230 RepID=E1QMG7_DESB2|nr:hypothetical protein Deba_2857 [Desulfarculus baarsii DSM 2075]